MPANKEILALNAFDPRAAGKLDAALGAAVDTRLSHFGERSVLFYERPIRMARAEGVHMFDVEGRRYLDVYNNVPAVGHSHPRVVEAIARQAGRLNTHTRYLNDVVDAYAERLLATFPAPIRRLALTCTGSEANDLALRIATTATGGAGFVVTEAAYHGNTAAVSEVSPSSRPNRPLAAHVRAVPAPDAYRAATADLGQRFAASIEAAIDDLEANGVRFAGLLVDSIFSSDGVFADPPGFLTAAVEAVHRRGGLFIADEVQPGFGRTGAMWGFTRHGVVPDIVTMGKPMGNGFPMAGVATRAELLDRFAAEVRYFNTFGGNTVAAAAGLAVLDVLSDEGLIENAAATGGYLIEGLRALANRRQAIGEVRGAGLFIGVELVHDRQTKTPAPEMATAMINLLRDRGVLIGAAGAFGATLKVRPPLPFAPADADQLLEACDAALGEIAASHGKNPA
ncbi:MAG TPA: aminotransferase class III-fold pyridoxal phosphate-dependent enzyme [Roseiarcus sp.]|nr:aminotransferase class III-fold pyridoxal phosphate-dependent enzyme [Roseiarcus sp.]